MRADFVKPNVLELIVNQLEPENANAVRVSMETGLRIGDVLSLRRENLRGASIHFVASKTGKGGSAKISSRLRRDLIAYAGSEWLFPGARGNAHRTRQAVWADVKRACRALGISGNISPHSARKTFAVEDYHEHGLQHVQNALQHDDTSVTLIYALSDVLTNQKNEQMFFPEKDNSNACSRECANCRLILERIERKLDLLLDKTSDFRYS